MLYLPLFIDQVIKPLKVMTKSKVQAPKLNVNAQLLASKVGTNPLYKGARAALVPQMEEPKKEQEAINIA